MHRSEHHADMMRKAKETWAERRSNAGMKALGRVWNDNRVRAGDLVEVPGQDDGDHNVDTVAGVRTVLPRGVIRLAWRGFGCRGEDTREGIGGSHRNLDAMACFVGALQFSAKPPVCEGPRRRDTRLT